jgi:hypothetical protein
MPPGFVIRNWKNVLKLSDVPLNAMLAELNVLPA